ncbi:MAG: hypothetical protein QXT28_12720 [Thermofilaceae archaeon]
MSEGLWVPAFDGRGRYLGNSRFQDFLAMDPSFEDVMRRVQREEAFRKRGIRPSVALTDGIKSMFYCWVRKPVEGYAEAFVQDDPEKYLRVDWRETSYTNFAEAKFVKPAGIITVSLRSREVFKYGFFSIETTLPPATEGGPALWFGFESDDYFRGGIAYFQYQVSTGKLYARVGSGSARITADLTQFLPSGYTTSRAIYSILIKRNMVVHMINGGVKCVTITGIGDSPYSAVIYSSPPFYVAKTQDFPVSALPVLIDIDGGDTSKEWVWDNVHPWLIRVGEGEPDAAFITALFAWGTGTVLRNYSISSGSVTSNPIPGVGRKSIGIVVDTAGTVELQAYSAGAGWATYDTYQITANKWLILKPDIDADMFRIIYTPSTYPAKVIDTVAIVI